MVDGTKDVLANYRDFGEHNYAETYESHMYDTTAEDIARSVWRKAFWAKAAELLAAGTPREEANAQMNEWPFDWAGALRDAEPVLARMNESSARELERSRARLATKTPVAAE
jgi:hypothetical protein